MSRILHITLEDAIAQPAKLSDHLNYASYASHRDRLTDWPAAKVQEMFIRLGIGSELEVADWEKRYIANSEEPESSASCHGTVLVCADCSEGYHDEPSTAPCSCLCHPSPSPRVNGLWL